MVLNLAWQAYEPQTCVRWMLADGQGNTAAAGDENGAIAIQHFDAFGVALDAVAVSGCRAAPLPDLAAAGDAGYRGQEGYRTHLTDPDAAYNQGPPQRSTGLMLLGARDYDPVLGRFMEPDPLSYDPGAAMQGIANRWAYCGNDPVNASDPSGNTMNTFFGALAIALGLSLVAFAGVMVFSSGGLGVLEPHVIGAFVQGLAAILLGIAMILDDLGETCMANSFYLMSGIFSTAAFFIAFGWGAGIGAAVAWIPNALRALGAVRNLTGGASLAAALKGLWS